MLAVIFVLEAKVAPLHNLCRLPGLALPACRSMRLKLECEAQEASGAERASTYTQACFPEAGFAVTRLYAAIRSYWSAAASSASVISNTVPLTRLSFLPLNVTLA